MLMVLLLIALMLSTACGGGEQVASSPTEAIPTGTTVEAIPTGTTEQPIIPPTKITGTSAITAPPTPDQKTSTSKLSISCTLNDAERKIQCESNFGDQASSRSWTSNATSRSSGGPDFEFVLEENVNKITITFKGCLNNSCQTATSIIDNSDNKVQTSETEKGSSEFKSTDLKGRNIFQLEFNEFPFSCTEFGDIKFTSVFFPSHLITAIEPMGKMAAMGSHVTPTDHLYVHRKFSAGEEYILAPSDGFIVKMSRAQEDQPLNSADEEGNYLENSNGPMVPDYRTIIMHSCTFFTVFIHLGELAPSIGEATGDLQKGDTWMAGKDKMPIPVKVGEPIARFGSDSFDWSVHDASTVLEGFIVPEHYESERYKIHTVDPFKFYTEPARTELLSKVVRKMEPRAGKIDYDIEGMIAGNWFLNGTVNYSGFGKEGFESQQGHLSIVYGSVDPSQVRISIGGNTGLDDSLCGICFGTYGVRGNQPDPATVNVSSGLVKYELMSRNEESRFVREKVGNTSIGTFLVQHLGDHSIQIEVIPGKSPEDVPGFSDKARIYRR